MKPRQPTVMSMEVFKKCLLGLAGLGLLAIWPSLPALQAAEPAVGKPTLLEFGAGFCYSCKEMEQIMAQLRESHGEQVEFRLVYNDKEPELFRQYRILLIPTQVFLDASGKEVERHIGALTKEQVLQKLKDLKFIQ